MIKVLHIQESIGSGGVERTRLSLAKLLNKSNFELKIICTNSYGSFADKIRTYGVEVLEIGNLKSIFDYKQHQKVQRVIEDFKPHIIHGAVFEGVTMAAINGFIKKVPIIIIEETSDPQNRSWKGHLLMKLFSFVSDKVIAISPNVADYLIERVKINKLKVLTINNGVEIPREVTPFEIEKLKKKYKIVRDDFIIGSVGRLLNDPKKYTDIIESIAKLRIARIKFIIIGDGKDRDLIQNKAIELKIENQLIMVGYQQDTAPFYKMMDIFCLASQREGFGLVAAEAMLNQIPVIATRVGGLQNVVKNNETGFLIPPNNPNEIGLKIITLLNHPELRKKMGKAGQYRALQNYSEQQYVKKIENFYLELCKQKKIL